MASGNLEEMIIAIQADISGVNKAMEEMKSSIGGATGESESKVKGLGNVFGAMAKASIVAIAGITGAFTAVAVASAKLGDTAVKSQGKLQAMTGASAEEAKKAGETVKNVFAKGWGESIDQVTNDYAKLKGALGEVDEKTLESAQILQASFENADIDSVARTLKTMKASYPGKSEAELMDLITKSFQKTGDASGDLLDTFNEYSGYFSKLGIDADEFASTLVQGSKDGAFNLDKVADAVKEFGIRAIDGSKSTAAGFSQIGLDAEEMGKKIAKGGKEGKEGFNETIEALKRMKDPVEQNAAGVALFGTQWEDVGPKVILNMKTSTKAIGEFQGSTKKAGDALSKDLGSKLESIKRSITTGFMSEDNVIYKSLVNLADYVSSHLPEIQKTINDTFKIIAGIFTGNSEEMRKSLDSIFGEESSEQIFGFITGVQELVQNLKEIVTDVFNSMGESVATVITGILEFWEENGPAITEAFTEAFRTIKKIVVPIIQEVGNQVSKVVNEIKKWWDKNGPELLENVSIVFKGIGKVVEKVMPVVKFIISTVFESVKNIITGALNVISGVFKVFAGLFTGDWSKLWSGVKQVLGGAVTVMMEVFNLKFIGKIGKLLSELGPNIAKLGKKAWDGLIDTISKAVKDVSSPIGKVISAVTKPFRDLPEKMMGFGKDTINGFVEGLKKVAGKVKSKIMEVVDQIPKSVRKLLGIASPAKRMIELAQYTGDGIVVGLNNRAGAIKASAENMGEMAKQGAKKGFSAFEDMVNGLGDANSMINIGANTASLDQALGKADLMSRLSYQNSVQTQQTLQVTIKGGFEKIADEVEARLVTKLGGMIGGRV